MPVEIKKLVIQAKMAETNSSSATPPIKPPNDVGDKDKQLIEACVKQVLKILDRQNSR